MLCFSVKCSSQHLYTRIAIYKICTQLYVIIFRQRGSISGRWFASLEFYRFHALVHDSVSGVVRWMDRIHVGLYAGRWRFVHSIFLGNGSHRKFGRTYISSLIFLLKFIKQAFYIFTMLFCRCWIFSWRCSCQISVHPVYRRRLPITKRIRSPKRSIALRVLKIG